MLQEFIDNYIDLSYLPRTSRGIDWKNIQHYPVKFKYRGVEDTLYIEKYIDHRYELISYKDHEYVISLCSLVRGALGKLFNFKVRDNFKYNIGDIIERSNKTPIKVLEQTRDTSKHHEAGVKSYHMLCLQCNNKFSIREGNLAKGDGCPYCSGHKVQQGFNDIATTNPEVAEYFVNKEDATKYTLQSNKKVDAQCPYCHTKLGLQSIYELQRRNVRCPSCGTGTSYPNRFMFNLLKQLGINVQSEVSFEWCAFSKLKNPNIIMKGRYDFVCPDKMLIIEMDSGLGHGRRIHSKAAYTKEETVYNDARKEQLAIQNGYTLVRVNCEYYGHEDRFIAVKDGIIRSDFSQHYDLSHIDWDEINKKSLSSQLKDICEEFNSGSSIHQIANDYGLTIPTIRKYLRRGTGCGLCNYTK